MIRITKVIGGVCATVVLVHAFATGAADVDVASGSGTLALNALASEPGATDERWRIEVQDETGTADNATVQGTVRIKGVPVERPDRVGEVNWERAGTDLSGTVSAPGGGTVLARFKGTVSETSLQGTFTTITGKTGSWVWEGPIPQGGMDSAP